MIAFLEQFMTPEAIVGLGMSLALLGIFLPVAIKRGRGM